MNIQKLTNIFIFFLSVWAIYTIVAFYFEVYIVFPFTLVENNEIPYNNLIAIRLAIFATFSFYGLMHLLHGSKEVYPIHFLKTFLFMLPIMGITVFMKVDAEVSLKQWLLVSFFFSVAIFLQLATGSKIRRYFRKKLLVKSSTLLPNSNFNSKWLTLFTPYLLQTLCPMLGWGKVS